MGTEGELTEQWARFAPAWIDRMDAGADDARVGLLDDWMLEFAGDVAGLDVVDLGCGEGRFCRMLAVRGARTMGVDLQPALVERARQLAGPTERYEVGDVTDLADLPDASFDLAISYIALVDVPDQQAAIAEARRLLRPGGRLLVANLAPMATATRRAGPWLRDAEGTKAHYVLDDYADEGPRDVAFPDGHVITNFHRMLSTTVNGFLEVGFVLTGLHEPLPTSAQLERAPGNGDLFRVPIYVIYELAVPAT